MFTDRYFDTLKKALVISLLTLLFANTSGYYLLYTFDYVAIKHEVAEMISELSPRETVALLFPIQNGKVIANDLAITDDNELIYQGKMYDVISRSESKCQIVYQCYSDGRETELNENLDKKIGSDTEQPTQKNQNSSLSKKPIKDFTNEVHVMVCFSPVSSISMAHSSFVFAPQCMSKTALHPPPEFLA